MMANIGIKNRKVLAMIIALAMVMTLVAPVTVLAAWPWETDTQAAGQGTQSEGAAQSVEDFEPVDVNGFYTNKTVKPIGNDKYHITLVANNGATALVNQTPIDIALVLDTSDAMNKTLYTRKATNLLTHTTFTEIDFNNNAFFSNGVSHDDLFDPKNPDNDSLLGNLFNGDRTYSNDKYITDPTDSSKYIYLAQTYKVYVDPATGKKASSIQKPQKQDLTNPNGYKLHNPEAVKKGDFIGIGGEVIGYKVSAALGINEYTYTFTDSEGYVWYSVPYYCQPVGTVIGNTDVIGNDGITFFREDWQEGDTDKTYTIHSFWSKSDTTATSEKLYPYSVEGGGYGLYIIDDNGNERDVHIDATQTRDTKNGKMITDYVYYIDDDNDGNHEYEYHSGNAVYGAKNGVFQGFRTYEDGKVVHEQSIDSRTLYARTANDVNVSRMDALKEAVENFILRVHRDCVDKGAQVKVGVVTFGSTQRTVYGINGVKGTGGQDINLADENATAGMIDKIYQFTAEGKAAEIDEGMDDANKLLTNNAHKNYCVAFTDAVPTNDTWRLFTSSTNGFNLTIANNAIATSKKMKDRGVQVYTVGLFDDSNVDQLHGDAFYYRQGAAWGADKYPCSGEVKSVWGRTDAASWTGREIDPINTAACNRMLNYMSNNFTAASSLGAKAMSWFDAPGSFLQQATKTGVSGFKITQNFKRNESKFYYPVTVSDADASSLYNAFDFLSKEMEAPSSVLRDQTKIFDTVTDYFTLNKESVKAYYQTGDSSGSEVGTNWTGTGENTDGVKTEVTDNSVTAWGVDFYEYFGSNARRLVVEFDVTRKPDFIGGNLVNTNGTNSGVYDGTDGKTLLVENFNVPLQKLDLRYNIKSADQGVYYSYEADLSELIDTSKVDGINNAFTTLVYTIYDGNNVVATYTVNPGETVGTWNINEKVDAEVRKLYPIITEDKTYHVTCKVTSNQDTDKSVQTKNADTDARFYVFTPEITVADGTTSYGKTEDVSPVNVTWKSATNSDAKKPREAAPDLTYTIKTKDGQTVENPKEYTLYAETDFVVDDITVPQSTFVYEVLETETVKDENGKDVTEWVYKPHEATRGGLPLTADSGLVSFKHLAVGAGEATAADTSDYNWSLKRFSLVIGTEFAGDYANPEDVTYTVSEVTNEGEKEVGTASFSKKDFTGLKANQPVEIKNLAPGKTYTVTKTSGAEKYIVTFTSADANGATVTDTDDKDEVFGFNYNGSADTVNLLITNTFDENNNPPASGIDGGTNIARLIANIMFTLAGVLGVCEVSYIAYLRIRN